MIFTVLLAALLATAVLGLIHPEYATANFTNQTEIPVNKLRCTDIRDSICVEWTEYKIVRH